MCLTDRTNTPSIASNDNHPYLIINTIDHRRSLQELICPVLDRPAFDGH
jgi:hypothetical protein